ncbi:MAG: alpha/beta fold hydrolase [Planctomycetota bacterium]|nr:alpha/beta fold hydrolase [Planctomycetota bacterium]MDG2142356.1 alpha/beta fold hydrolase [Planctomycetota bacterium]
MSSPDFLLTNLELRASNPDGSEGAGLSHQTGGIGGAGMVLVRVLELGPPPSQGVPDGAAIVVHDAGDHGARYEQLADRLATAGWMVSLPDLRGHGASEGERGHTTGIPEPVRDIHSVREHVAYRMPDAKSVVIGVGSGALWAMAYALKHQDEVHGLVLAGPLLQDNFGAPQKIGGMLGMFKKVEPLSPCVIPWKAEDVLSEPGDKGTWNADPKRDNTVTKGTVDAIVKAMAECPAPYAALNMPTLVLAGSEDPICTPADAAAFAKKLGAKSEVIEGARHSIFHGPTSEAAIDHVVNWLGTL